ncbi:MAG: histidine phosphotransferase family protein [Pseudomonadota bacterium]
MKSIALAQNLLAKLCHDLAGNLTALNGGAEFLEDSNQDTQRKARELIYLSVKQATSRLTFFRIAYGTQKHSGEANLKEVHDLSASLLADSKVSLDFHTHYFHQPEIFICSNTGKLILCMIYIAYGVLLYGGIVKVDIEKTSGGKRIVITASGKKVKNDIDRNSILCGEVEDVVLTPSNVHHYYTSLIIQEIGDKISINRQEEEIQYIIE